MGWLRNCVGALVLSLAVPSVGHAMEPGNDTAPWKSFSRALDVTLYDSDVSGRPWSWWWYENISSNSDVDHVLVSCYGRTVQSAGIELRPANGDLDIYVYDMAGNLLGSSGGVTERESVDVRAFGKQQVVIRVYGYNGSTGIFTPQVTCG